jgi:DNA polymerase III alpha subunit
MLYQEDVMRIAVEVAGYTVAEADRFRSEVSKAVYPARVQAQYVDFVHRRAPQAGIESTTAEAIWDEVLRFAAYSYCKAHATVYANIAWETAWLKAHYPAEFYCSLFNNHQGMYPPRVYVWDAKRHGVSVLPPHVNHSEIEWSLQNGVIRAGLNIVKGLCGGTIRMILEQRQKARFRDLDDLRRRVRFRKPELQNLIHVGACDGLGSTRPAMLSRLRFAPPSRDQLMLFDIWGAVPSRALVEHDRPEERGRDALATRRLVPPDGMSLRGAQRRSNLNPEDGRLLRYARNDMTSCVGWQRQAQSSELADGVVPERRAIGKVYAKPAALPLPPKPETCARQSQELGALPTSLLVPPDRRSCGDARPSIRSRAGSTKSVEALPDYDRIAKLEAELDVTGIPFCMHPAVLLPRRYVPANRLPGFLDKRVTVAGFVATARRAKTSDNRVMGFVTVEDATEIGRAHV